MELFSIRIQRTFQLVSTQFKYVNSGKQKVDNILNGIKWISKGGY